MRKFLSHFCYGNSNMVPSGAVTSSNPAQTSIRTIGESELNEIPIFTAGLIYAYERVKNRENDPILEIKLDDDIQEDNDTNSKTCATCDLEIESESNSLLMKGQFIEVEESQRGNGYSSMMRAIQILYAENYRKEQNIGKIKYFHITGAENQRIHYHHGFTSFGDEEWYPENDRWDGEYNYTETETRTKPIEFITHDKTKHENFWYKKNKGPKALAQVFEDMKNDKTARFETFLLEAEKNNIAGGLPPRCTEGRRSWGTGFLIDQRMYDPVEKWAHWTWEEVIITQNTRNEAGEKVLILDPEQETDDKIFLLKKGMVNKAVIKNIPDSFRKAINI